MKISNAIWVVFVIFLFASCRTLSYFDSPNSLRNIEGTLYLHNGKSYTGKLIIETENIFGSPVKLFADKERKPMQFSLQEVKGYTARNAHYELKEIKEGITLGRQQYFMRRLSPENSKFHLYELLRKAITNKTSTRHDPEYYVQLPNERENVVYAANGSRFVPHFEEKVSTLVKDCPTLAQKVADKKEGYFFAQVSILKEKRADVLLRIIQEYNACKGAESETANEKR